MTRTISIIASLLLAGLLVAGCNTSSATPAAATAATPSPSPTATPAPTESPSESAAASGSPSGSAPAGGVLPSLSLQMHEDPALEAQLPSQVNGATVQKLSLKLSQLGALGGDTSSSQTLDKWLAALGKNPNDVSFASGIVSGASTTIGAVQVKGVAQAVLLSTFQAAAKQQGATVSQATIGGKQVISEVMPSGGGTVYVYAHDDVLFSVQSDSAAAAAAAVQALP